ncbi:MAG: PLDc N-terminal domain-containing protein [Gemmatimonadaceae bacterium]|nr:PLDc N-terminal domain-containing protein [Gemmatimonadaceae bacterium]
MIQVPPHGSMLRGGTSWPLWFVAIAVIAGVLALASIWLGRRHGRPAKIVWTAIVVLVPVLGACGWFLLGHQRRRRPRP